MKITPRLLLIIGLGVFANLSLYAESSQKIAGRTCFDYKENADSSLPVRGALGTRFLIDHDSAAVGLGAVFETKERESAWVPYFAIGQSFFPSGLSWQTGISYCYRQFSIRLGYDGKYDIPSDEGEEYFPLLHTGYLISDILIDSVLISLLLKYGENWEHTRTDNALPYFKEKVNATELGFFLTTLILKTPVMTTGLSVNTVGAFLDTLDGWTVNSLLTLDSTLIPIRWGEMKLIAKVAHTASSDNDRILAVRNMFFLGPFPAQPTERFYEYETSGFLTGDFAWGYRFFPFYKLGKSAKKNSANNSADDSANNSTKYSGNSGGIYIAPYLHYGWGVDRIKPIGLVETAVGVSLHVGYKLPGESGAISFSVGWNNRQNFVITIITNF